GDQGTAADPRARRRRDPRDVQALGRLVGRPAPLRPGVAPPRPRRDAARAPRARRRAGGLRALPAEPVVRARQLDGRGRCGRGARRLLPVERGPLAARPGCQRTNAEPELRLDVAGLGSAYLGGFTFAELARAGRVEELADGAVARADELFRVDRAPWCPEIF